MPDAYAPSVAYAVLVARSSEVRSFWPPSRPRRVLGAQCRLARKHAAPPVRNENMARFVENVKRCLEAVRHSIEWIYNPHMCEFENSPSMFDPMASELLDFFRHDANDVGG